MIRCWWLNTKNKVIFYFVYLQWVQKWYVQRAPIDCWGSVVVWGIGVVCSVFTCETTGNEPIMVDGAEETKLENRAGLIGGLAGGRAAWVTSDRFVLRSLLIEAADDRFDRIWLCWMAIVRRNSCWGTSPKKYLVSSSRAWSLDWFSVWSRLTANSSESK